MVGGKEIQLPRADVGEGEAATERPAFVMNKAPVVAHGTDPDIVAAMKAMGVAPPEVDDGVPMVSAAADRKAERADGNRPAPAEPVLDPEDAREAAQQAAPAVESEVSEPVSGGWAAVKGQERANRQERAQLEQERREMQRAVQQLRQEQAQLQASQQQWLADLKRDPFGTLDRAGVPFAHLADRAVKGDMAPSVASPATVAPAVQLSEVEQLRSDFKALQDQLAQRDQQSAVQNYRYGAMAELQDPQFKLLSTYGSAVEEAVELAGRYSEATGTLLTPRQALTMLQDAYKSQLKTLGTHEAVREVFGFAPSSPAPSSPAAPPKGPAPGKTVTQAIAAPTIPAHKGTSLVLDNELAAAVQLVPADVWKEM